MACAAENKARAHRFGKTASLLVGVSSSQMEGTKVEIPE
jgi:hypothetical protein